MTIPYTADVQFQDFAGLKTINLFKIKFRNFTISAYMSRIMQDILRMGGNYISLPQKTMP
jgi:hypothetical protein